MTQYQNLALTLVASALLAACAGAPPENAKLSQARNDYRMAQDNPQTRDLAGAELKTAEQTLTKANQALARGDKSTEVDQQADQARQQVAIARETADRKKAEQAVAHADQTRDQVLIAARTTEADNAHARNRRLEAQYREMKARKTAHGMVITLGDVLFDTDRASLKSGASRRLDTLVTFLQRNPQRRVMIEGFTDSTGSTSHNQELSGQRAETIRAWLVSQGVGNERISTRAYAEEFPVASNQSQGGRQLNRRVELILSDEQGNIPQR